MSDCTRFLDQPSYLDMTKSNLVVAKALPVDTDTQRNDQSTDDAIYVYPDFAHLSKSINAVEEQNEHYDSGSLSNEAHQQKSPSLAANSTHYDQLIIDTNTNECPYAELPAEDLSLRKATQIGWLTQPRRFWTSKRYYAGILDGWLLLYSSGEAAIRPSSCYSLKNCIWTDIRVSKNTFRLTLITADAHGNIIKQHFETNCHNDHQVWVTALAESNPAAYHNFLVSPTMDTPPSSSVYTNQYSLSVVLNKANAWFSPSPKIDVHQRDQVDPPPCSSKTTSSVESFEISKKQVGGQLLAHQSHANRRHDMRLRRISRRERRSLLNLVSAANTIDTTKPLRNGDKVNAIICQLEAIGHRPLGVGGNGRRGKGCTGRK